MDKVSNTTDESNQNDQDASAGTKLPQPATAQTGSSDTVSSNSTPTTDQSSTKDVGQSNPAVAEDADLIEKEWIEKAKEIVEKNKNDPHALNKELNKVKADYIKKRYNKEVRTSED